MVSRYRAQNADFDELRAVTIERLAAVCQLEVGALYAWIRHGRQEAMLYQRRFAAAPVAFEPVDLARELLQLLEQRGAPPGEAPAGDYRALSAALEQQRALAPALFDRLVAITSAAEALKKVAATAALAPEDWLKLQQLLDAEPGELQQRYGFVRAVARTDAQVA